MAEDPIRQLFESLDRDGDGALSRDDLSEVLPDLPPERLNEIIRQLDTGGTGIITFREFYVGFDYFMGSTEGGDDEDGGDGDYEEVDPALMGEVPNPNKVWIRELFDRLDTDNDGEVRIVDVQKLFPGRPANESKTIVLELDQSKTLTVSFPEFYAGFDQFARYLKKKGGLWPSSMVKNLSEEAVEQLTSRGVTVESKGVSGGIAEDEDEKAGERKTGGFSELKSQLDMSLGALDDGDDGDSSDDEDFRAMMLAQRVLSEQANADPTEQHDFNSLRGREKELEIDLLRNQVRRMRQKNKNASRKYALLSELGSQMEEDNASLEKKRDEAEKALKAARAEVRELTEALTRHKDMLGKSEGQAGKAKADLSGVKQTHEETYAQLLHEQKLHERTKTKLKESEAELAGIRGDKSSVARSGLRGKLSAMNGMMEGRRRQTELAQKKKIAALTTERDSLADKLAYAEMENADQARIIEDLQRMLDDLRDQGPGGVSLQDELVTGKQGKKEPRLPAGRGLPRRAGGMAPSAMRTMALGQIMDERKNTARKVLQRLNEHGTLRMQRGRHRTVGGSDAWRDQLGGGPRAAAASVIARGKRQSFKKSASAGMMTLTPPPVPPPPDRSAEVERLKKQLALKDKYIKELEDKIRELLARIAELEAQLRALQALLNQREEDKKRRQLAEQKRQQVELTPLQQTELRAYAHYFNHVLQNDAEIKDRTPFDPDTPDLLMKMRDGWVLCKFVNAHTANTCDTRALHKPLGEEDALSDEDQLANMRLALETCRAIGVQVQDVQPLHVMEPHREPQVVIDLLWRLVRSHVMRAVSVKEHPELVRLRREDLDEDVADLLKLSDSRLLLRWANYHLREASKPGSPVRAIAAQYASDGKTLEIGDLFDNNFKNSAFHAVLLHQLEPAEFAPAKAQSVLGEADYVARSVRMLMSIGQVRKVPKPCLFVTPPVAVEGGKVAARLQLALLASLFNTGTSLDQLSEEEFEQAELLEDDGDGGDTREERAFRLWINSMGLGDLYINNLFTECRDGLVLLRVMDRVSPGIVPWKRVELKPTNRFKKLSNCNLVVHLGKNPPLNFSLVNVGGVDLVDGNRKLTLSVVWQLMHKHLTEFLREVHQKKFGVKRDTKNRRASLFGKKGGGGGGAQDDDKMIIDWACQRAKEGKEVVEATMANRVKGTSFEHPFSMMRSFNDASLSDSLFFLHLLSALNPRIVDWRLVTKGATPADKLLNARYAISVARKLGATIFVLPEDIAEVKPKMITTFVGSILGLDTLKVVKP